MKNPKVLVVATSRKTRGGITSVVKAHETGEQWRKYHCKWIETHRDGNSFIKMRYLVSSLFLFITLLPFYDIVHIHAGLRTSVDRKIIFAKLAKFFRRKIIIHFHPATEKHLFQKEFSGKIFKLFCYSDLLIVLSHQWENWINEAYPNNQFKFKVVYNPCPKVVRSSDAKENIILYAGTLNDRKGYDRLIEAFSKIAPEHRDWKVVFAGNGEIDKAKHLALECGIESQVEFLGWVAGTAKEHIFQSASVYCLPSWGEGFPMGVLDAMAYGIPVVTTPVGGIPELLADGVNGFIFDAYDTEALSEKLSILMSSAEVRTRFVYETDKLVITEFNIDVINKNIGMIYNQIGR